MSADLFAGMDLLQDACPEGKRSGLARDLFLDADAVVSAAQRLLAADYHLEDISGMDACEGILVTYHFDHFEQPGRLALRVLAPHETPRVPSIAHIFGGAEWHERELADFYGVVFEGNPNPVPLLLLPGTDVTTPLLKAEKARKSVADLIDPGKIAQKSDGFDLFTPRQDAKEARE